MLPNGRTVGSYVNQVSKSVNMGNSPAMPAFMSNPIGTAQQVYSGTNFRKMFGGPGANYFFLGDAGNFAYGAVSANIGVPLSIAEFVAGSYASVAHQASDRVGPYGMDQSATINVPKGYNAKCTIP